MGIDPMTIPSSGSRSTASFYNDIIGTAEFSVVKPRPNIDFTEHLWGFCQSVYLHPLVNNTKIP